MTTITPEQKKELLVLQQEEINGQYTYARLAEVVKDAHNSEVIKKISKDERMHYEFWKTFTQQDVKPNQAKIRFFYWVSKLFGLTFGIRLMELGEEKTQKAYVKLPPPPPPMDEIPGIKDVLADEERHEEELMGMLDEESLRYAGSVVLGLNDALVELTGALAGLTFAFRDSHTIALAGLITGISAAFSMAASDYLSNKADEGGKNHTAFGDLYRHRLHHHGFHPDRPLPDLRQLHLQSGMDDPKRDPGDRGVQLLHLGGAWLQFQATLFRNGGHQPGRGFIFVPDRQCDQRLAGREGIV